MGYREHDHTRLSCFNVKTKLLEVKVNLGKDKLAVLFRLDQLRW